MQKKLIALAVAGLASAGAFAQSNVTIYGVADASFESEKADDAVTGSRNIDSRNRVNTNSSLIGFKGSEDLGNGLKALFQFESTVNLTNQNAADTNGTTPAGKDYTDGKTENGNGLMGAKRDTFVALSGNFGTVLGGYVSTPYRSIVTGFDVVPGSAGAGASNGVFGKALAGTNLVFRTNAIAYASPSFNGFSGVIAYVPNSGKTVDPNNNTSLNEVNPHGWNLALNYTNGGLKLAYSYLKLTDVGVGGDILSSEDHKANLLAASYDFGQGTTLVGMYQHFKGDVNVAGGNGYDVNRNSYFLGLKHVMGVHEFAVSYQHASDLGGNVTNVGTTAGITDKNSNSDTGASQWTLRYGYNFSKRTQVYALYTRLDNKDNANFNLANGAVGDGTAVGYGSNPTVYGVGIRHSF